MLKKAFEYCIWDKGHCHVLAVLCWRQIYLRSGRNWTATAEYQRLKHNCKTPSRLHKISFIIWGVMLKVLRWNSYWKLSHGSQHPLACQGFLAPFNWSQCWTSWHLCMSYLYIVAWKPPSGIYSHHQLKSCIVTYNYSKIPKTKKQKRLLMKLQTHCSEQGFCWWRRPFPSLWVKQSMSPLDFTYHLIRILSLRGLDILGSIHLSCLL